MRSELIEKFAVSLLLPDARQRILFSIAKRGLVVDLRRLLAKNVKIGRNRLGYSQMKLAELCDVSTSFIGEIETSKKFPSVKTMEKICNALAMKPYQLFFDDDEWAVYDRQAPILEIYQELKERINTDLEDIIKKYLQSD